MALSWLLLCHSKVVSPYPKDLCMSKGIFCRWYIYIYKYKDFRKSPFFYRRNWDTSVQGEDLGCLCIYRKEKRGGDYADQREIKRFWFRRVKMNRKEHLLFGCKEEVPCHRKIKTLIYCYPLQCQRANWHFSKIGIVFTKIGFSHQLVQFFF